MIEEWVRCGVVCTELERDRHVLVDEIHRVVGAGK